MITEFPFLIDDFEPVRRRLTIEKDEKMHDGAQAGGVSSDIKIWRMLRSSVRSSPLSFPWYAPFVACVTGEEKDIENAKMIIRTYVAKLEPMSFCSGLQFHFWCFAFPHAKWCLYFQWLCSIGAFDEAERKEISEKLISYHFVNFFYGMRTKPEPECVDNQTLSLALSTALVGYLFSHGQNPSEMATIMFREGMRRLPAIVGDLPVSGYSGEGSDYMDCVIGPAIPLAIEFLQHVEGETDLLYKPFPPGGARPVDVLRMLALECMPGGLLLPWDNYGYKFGLRAPIAYGARMTGESIFFDVLKNECILSYDIGSGWAYDDFVWTLIWWPDGDEPHAADHCWAEEHVGGALANRDSNLYLMQMWDDSAPDIPTRLHVNPNAVLFNGYGIPLSADGSKDPEICKRFVFEDTWRTVSFLAIASQDSYNYGDGCAGAHSVVIIDGCESMRAHSDYPQTAGTDINLDIKSLCCDVTPIYRENYPDISCVKRKSSLLCERFFVIEDYVNCGNEHDITSRFLLRPQLMNCANGTKIKTPEGVTLHIVELLGGNTVTTEEIHGYPVKPDGGCLIADFTRRGKEVRKLFVAFISTTLEHSETLQGFDCVHDAEGYDMSIAREKLAQSDIRLDMNLPAYMEAELPNHKTWWYGKKINIPHEGCYLKLPLGMHEPRLFLSGQELDLSPWKISMELIAPVVPIPAGLTGEAELLLKTDVPVDHYLGDGDGTIGMYGGVHLMTCRKGEQVTGAVYEDGGIRITTSDTVYCAPYQLMRP